MLLLRVRLSASLLDDCVGVAVNVSVDKVLVDAAVRVVLRCSRLQPQHDLLHSWAKSKQHSNEILEIAPHIKRLHETLELLSLLPLTTSQIPELRN